MELTQVAALAQETAEWMRKAGVQRVRFESGAGADVLAIDLGDPPASPAVAPEPLPDDEPDDLDRLNDQWERRPWLDHDDGDE